MLAFFLLWTSVVFFFTFFKTKRSIYLIGLFLCTWLFSFTRMEGVLIQLTIFLVFSFKLFFTKIFSLKKKLLIILIYLSVVGSILPIFKHFNYDAYLSRIIIHVNIMVKRSISSAPIIETIKQGGVIANNNIKLGARIPIFMIQMLAKYNLVLILFK